MPVLQANNITIRFENGATLFENLSCTLNSNRVAIVGRNGVGKSLFAAALTGLRHVDEGTVTPVNGVGYYSQTPSSLLTSDITIAQYLELDALLDALVRIEAGECDPELFDLVGDQWQIDAELNAQLQAMGISADAHFPCHQLSGGQLARLQLWRLLTSDHDLLLLDEPSNHLDINARRWLIEQMRGYAGRIVLISHDRMLLREVDQILELSGLGLTSFGGNYDFYVKQKQQEVLALERQLESVHTAQKRLELKAQKSRERAEQRAAKGNRMRKSGSQPKILLDAMRDSAEVSISNRNKNLNGRRESLAAKQVELSQRYEQVKEQKLYLGEGSVSKKQLVSVVQGVLPFGSVTPINVAVSQGEKVSLEGNNGCGKSTLLNVLRGSLALKAGECHINSTVYYLDQHFSLINNKISLLDNLIQTNRSLTTTDARTLLAGIGFRRDDVYRKAEVLSGGEKMKLAMLIVAHQPQPALLLLDEPDNHLDLESMILLSNTLNDYQGTFVVVSHDQDFIRGCGITKSVYL